MQDAYQGKVIVLMLIHC